MQRLDLGPLFWSEVRRISRHWWFYALRSILVGGLLLGLGGVMAIAVRRLDLRQVSEAARVGEWLFVLTVLVQLSMVLLAAPAATAGAFCTEMAHGHVCLMLVSGMSTVEIVVGTLAARLLHLLGAVACVVPVLALLSSLGGVPPEALVRLELVTVGTAMLSCAMALAVSIGSHRLHETLMATYALIAGWVLGYAILFMIRMTLAGRLIPAGCTAWFLSVNPYWLALEPIFSPSTYRPTEEWSFLAGSTSLALGTAAVAAWLLKAASLTNFEPARRRSWLSRLLFGHTIVSLDAYPAMWRECRSVHSSWWLRSLWAFYVVGALLFSVLAVVETSLSGFRRTVWTIPFNGFQAAVGLGLLSLLTPATLAEERARGSLDVLLSTPLATSSLVLSKWFACYRLVPCLALLPAVVAAAHAWPLQRWTGISLVVGMILAHGATVTSLGIGLATWVPRIDRALILSAAASVLITAGWIPLVLFLFEGSSLMPGLAMASPLFGVVQITSDMVTASPAAWSRHAGWASFWIVFFSFLALAMLLATLWSFDRCLGRITLRAPAASHRGHWRNTCL